MTFQDVCRLCCSVEKLLWVFDKEIADNMTEIIQVTCGVEICQTDRVTQMVCSTCCHITVRMFQFRTKAIKNDKDLKAKCADYNIDRLTRKSKLEESFPTATETPPKGVVRAHIPQVTIKQVFTPLTIPAMYRFAHPSVKEIVQKNPNIKLPTSCLKSHVGPYITLLTDEVDEYFKERNMTDSEIAKVKAEAYELAVDWRKPKKRRKTSQDEKSSGKSVRLSTDSSDRISVSSGDVQLPQKENLKGSANETPKTNNDKIRFNTIKVRPILESDAVRKKSPPKPKTDKPVPDKPNESFFQNLLGSPPQKKPHVREEITLKSLLYDQGEVTRLTIVDDDDDDSDIDVGGPPSPVPSPTPSDKHPFPPKSTKQVKPKKPNEKSAKKDHTKKPETSIIIIPDDGEPKPVTDNVDPNCNPDEDFSMFDSRPILTPGFTDGEPMVISDSEEDSKNNDKEDASSESTAVDPDGRSSTTSKYSDVDKTTFTEALQLAPKESEGSNQPDLSLVDLTNKTYKLYTCRVCDSQHTSRKELKYHERKNHTKCPFCSKRFRSLANRDEHVGTTCSVNRSPIKLKHPRLALIRVDEVEEIRTRYARAFEEFENCANEEEAEGTACPEGISRERELEKRTCVETVTEAVRAEPGVASRNCDPQTAEAISELEKFLNYSEAVPTKDKRNSVANTKAPREPAGSDVICISDEESEECRNPPPRERFATQDDFEIKKSGERTISIVNSELLNNINIHDNDVTVLKALLLENSKRRTAITGNSTDQIKTILQDSPIMNCNLSRMKIFKNLRKFLYKYKLPVELRYNPTVSVQYKPATPKPPRRVSGLWHNLVPRQLKPCAAPLTDTRSGPIGPLEQTQRSTAISNTLQPHENSGGDIQDSDVSTIPSSSLATSNPPSSVPNETSTLTTTSASLPVISSVQSSCAPLSTTEPTVDATTVPLTSCATNVPPTISVASGQPTVGVTDNVTTVQSTGGVTTQAAGDQPSSIAVAQLESITNSLMPTSQSSVGGEGNGTQTTIAQDGISSLAVQSAIRVKDLSELS